MRLLFFSDLHANRFIPHASINEQGQNTRLANALGVLEGLTNYVAQEQIELVIFGGDLFHVRGKVDTVTFNAVYQAIKGLVPFVEDVILIVGNHDQDIEQPDQHCLEPFKEFCRVIDKPQIVRSGPYDMAFFPFNHDAQEQIRLFKEFDRRSLSLVATHIGVAGIEGETFFIPEQVRKEHLPQHPLTLLGHYHNGPQVTEKCYYATSAQALTWIDVNKDKYWLDITTRRHGAFTVKRISAPGLRFVERSVEKLTEHWVRGNIVRTRAKAEDVERVRTKLEGWGAFDVIVLPIEPGRTPNSNDKTVRDSRLTIPQHLDHHVDECCPQGLSPVKLKRIGREILRGEEG